MSKLFGDSGKKKLSFNRKRPVAEMETPKKTIQNVNLLSNKSCVNIGDI